MNKYGSSAVIFLYGDDVVKTKLTEIKENELKTAFIMHFKGFLHTFFKYRDWWNNPIFLVYPKFRKYFYSENMFMYFILCDDKPVGQLWILKKENEVYLARLFVLKEFQNKGIATKALQLAEQIFSGRQRWRLDTIKEEKNNCRLYEKSGYKQTGAEKKINKRMTIIEYEKEYKNELHSELLQQI